MSDGTTHYAGCIQAGPKHYECALQEIGRLRLTITHLRVELEKKAAGTYEDAYEAGYQAGMEEKKPWIGLTDEEVPDYVLYDNVSLETELTSRIGNNNVRYTFDGETNKLKSAEVVK